MHGSGCRQWPGWRCDGTTSCGTALPLTGGSGSCLRVMSHGVRSVISSVIYSGLYCGGRSLDMPHHCARMLTLSDGVTRGAVAVDLHFFSSSYNRPIRGLLLEMFRVLFQHSFIDVYGHVFFLLL